MPSAFRQGAIALKAPLLPIRLASIQQGREFGTIEATRRSARSCGTMESRQALGCWVS